MAAEQFLNRFSDFHKELDELKKIADDTWYQGGMVWTVELLKRGASTVDLVGYQNVFSEHRNISILTWAELIWSIKGQHGNFDNALDNEQWQAEESRNIDLHMQDARKLLEYFRPVGRREKYFMRTDRCPASLAVTTMFVSNRHAMKHTVFWSMD